MMFTTEQEATRVFCHQNMSDWCVGSKCMAWRWGPEPRDHRKKSLYSKRTGEKVNAAFGNDAEWRLDDPTETLPARAGYCGLAGIVRG